MDVLIFCEMSFKYFDYSGKNRRPSPKEIGKKLGLDERTVRLRTRRMEREGFIQYYQTVPNLWLFGKPLACLCNFQAPSLTAKKHALESLRGADDIIDIADFLGESFGVTVSASSETQAVEEAGRLAGRVKIPRFQMLPPRYFPPPQKSLDRLDWQLVKALRYDAARPTEEIARQLGITYRMTDYTIGKLFEKQALSTRAIINARDPKGIIFYSLNLSLDSTGQDRTIRRLRGAYGERVWWSFASPGSTIILFLFATSIGQAEDDLLQALSDSNVQNGSLTMFKGWIEPTRPSWIDRMVDQRIREQGPTITVE